MSRWGNTRKLYDRQYTRGLFHMIDAYGKNISIYYRTDTACPSCPWDPINEESTNPSCSTCDGTGRVVTETEVVARGFINKMLGNLRYIKDGGQLYQVAPMGDARITLKLKDLLINDFVSTSASVLRGAQRVVAEGVYYRPKDEKRFGIADEHIIEVTLERIREESGTV